MGKETPRGLANEGAGFLEAAKGVCSVDGCPKRNCLLVYYYLVCHSIELSCKAILLKEGVPMKALKGMGHDLSKLMLEIKRKNPRKGLNESDVSVVRMMNPDYRNRRYSYAMGGHEYTLVMPPLPLKVAENISKLAFNTCEGRAEKDDE